MGVMMSIECMWRRKWDQKSKLAQDHKGILCLTRIANIVISVQFSSVQSLSRVRLFTTPWITARQASVSITNSRSSPRLMSIESVMPSSHLILCHPLLLLPPTSPSMRVFSNDSTSRMRGPKYWSFSFSIIPSLEKSKSKLQWSITLHLSEWSPSKSTDNKCRRGCKQKGIFLCCWWECRLMQPQWTTVWRFP